MIEIDFSYSTGEKNTNRDTAIIYIQPIYDINKEKCIYNYRTQDLTTLKDFTGQSASHTITNNNTKWLELSEFILQEDKLVQKKSLTAEEKQNIINNLHVNSLIFYE